nr:DUF6221 family protein [Streptomyces pratensis]
MEHDGGAVTVTGVSARAGVSRTFPYDAAWTTLLARLRHLASKQPATGQPALPDHQRISTKSQESLVRALREADRELHMENERLRQLANDHEAMDASDSRSAGLAYALPVLGQSYAEHPGYQQEWRP